MAEQKIVGWFTSKGKHIPILEAQSKQEALSNYIKNSDKNKSVAEKNEDIKQKQIAKNKEQADKLNNKKEKSNKLEDRLKGDALLDAQDMIEELNRIMSEQEQ